MQYLGSASTRGCQCYLGQPCDISGVEKMGSSGARLQALTNLRHLKDVPVPKPHNKRAEFHHRPIPVRAISHPPSLAYDSHFPHASSNIHKRQQKPKKSESFESATTRTFVASGMSLALRLQPSSFS